MYICLKYVTMGFPSTFVSLTHWLFIVPENEWSSSLLPQMLTTSPMRYSPAYLYNTIQPTLIWRCLSSLLLSSSLRVLLFPPSVNLKYNKYSKTHLHKVKSGKHSHRSCINFVHRVLHEAFTWTSWSKFTKNFATFVNNKREIHGQKSFVSFANNLQHARLAHC